MATRVGIELSPAACRIVEIEDRRPWRRSQDDTRVRSFAVLPPSGPDLRAKLESLRRRQAAVVVWGGRSEHRQVMVTAGSYESMRAEALAALSAAGLATHGVWADIAPASSPDDRAARRPVIVSMALASELSDAIRPIREAGIRVRTVTTPAVALASLARTRLAFSVPGAIESYIALDEQVTCIALVRSGVLLAARDLPWGYVDRDYAGGGTRPREDITAVLADAIREFVAAIGGSPGDIGQVCVCGGLPELRSMAAALMEQLDVEVEPLDSLFGIDAARLPEPADEFRERGAELRLAWAVAADWPPAINLLRARRRQVSKTWLARAAVVAGAAAGLGGSWWVVERSHLFPAPSTRSAANAADRARGAASKSATPTVVVKRPPIVTPPPGVGIKAPVVTPPVVANKAPAVTPPPAVVTKPPVVTPPSVVANKAPVVPPPAVVTKPPVVTPPSVVANKAPVVPPPVVATKAPVVTPPSVVANKGPAVTPLPVVATKPPVVTPPSVAANKAPAVTPLPAVVTKPPAVVTKPPAVVTKPPVVTPPSVAANKAPAVTPPPVVVTKPPVVTPPPAVLTKPPVVTPPSVVANKAPAVTPPPAVLTKPPVVTPPSVVANKAPAVTPPPAVATKPPVAPPPIVTSPPAVVGRAPASVPPPSPIEKPAPVERQSTVADRPLVRTEPPLVRAKRALPSEVALPFDAVLGMILYSADRKLAIIDNRIVGVGDEVRGARVIEITSSTVFLRDPQGRLRRLALGAGGR